MATAKAKPSQSHKTPSSLTFNWTRCEDLPEDLELWGQPVCLDDKAYVCGESGDSQTVLKYTPENDQWDALPPPPVEDFTVATVKGCVVLVGGRNKSTRNLSDKIFSWEPSSQEWLETYPPMPIELVSPAAIGYKDYLIVAGGRNCMGYRIKDVDILDPTSNKWFSDDSLPTVDAEGSVLIEDTLYLFLCDSKDVLRAHVPTLISQATSGKSGSVWESLSQAPYYFSSPVKVQSSLYVLGGNDLTTEVTSSVYQYNCEDNQWAKVGDLPEPMFECSCVSLSGMIFIFGSNSTRRYVYTSKQY